MNHVGPDLFRREIADLYARNRFHIRCSAFLDPVVLFGNVGKRRVNQFVRHQPIFFQLLAGCVPSHEDASKRRVASPSFSPERATLPFRGVHSDSREGDRENSVVMCNGPGSLRYPSEDRLRRQVEAVRSKAYLDGCAANP